MRHKPHLIYSPEVLSLKFTIEYTDLDITPSGGLPLVGYLLDKCSLKKRINLSRVPCAPNPAISHSDVIYSYIGLLCQGKNDFDHIENERDDIVFSYAMGIEQVPSSPTLRQRLDQAAGKAGWEEILLQESAHLIKTVHAPLTPIVLGSGKNQRKYLPLDVDVSPFDNSKTKKEGVSRTYKGFDGYAPNLAYLGLEGYWINLDFREGKTHCQKGTAAFLEDTLNYAQMISSTPVLVRLDSGNDSADNIKVFDKKQVDFIIKRNPRKETPEQWFDIAKEIGIKTEPRKGKIVYTGSICRKPGDMDKDIRIAFRVIERTVLANGQGLLIPDLELETYWTSLPDKEEDIIRLYHEHGTCEQFHSEIKTDLDLERLPSGKFATNNLILHLGLIAYNILRILGQMTVQLPNGLVPLKKKAQRRRIRTVIQNLITMAAIMIRHARQTILRFRRKDKWLPVFEGIQQVLSLTSP